MSFEKCTGFSSVNGRNISGIRGAAHPERIFAEEYMGFLKREKLQENRRGLDGTEKNLGWKEYLLYYIAYTVLFAVTAATIFVWFYLKKRRFVWQTDGISQHYYGLLYFSRWGKEVLRNFRETGVWHLPTFSLRMGYGGDLYTTLAYYVLGDPFSLPSVFVPEEKLLLFHDLMLLVRFWLAGITFSAYNFYMGRKNRIGVLIGALIYIFNGFTMSGMRHHYFLNPFVFFPLLLIGCEWYLRKKKPWLFLVMVFVTAVSNFYFFYMLVIMTALYVIWRSVRIHGLRHFGAVILDGVSFLWYGLIGTLLSSFLLLPVILRFLQDPRTGTEKHSYYMWPVWFYRNFIDSFVANGTSALSESWTYMGFGAAALLCVFFLFTQKRKHFDQKAAFVVLTVFLLTPAVGYVMNGFSYPANRWMWAYALLVGTITATAVPEIVEAGSKKLLAVLLLLTAAVGVCVGWEYTFSRASAQAVIISLLGLAAILLGRTMLLEKERALMLSGVLPEEGKGPEESEAGDPGIPAGNIEVKTAAWSPAAAKADRRKRSVGLQAVLLLCAVLSVASEAYFNFAPDKAAKTGEYLSRAQIDMSMTRDAKAAADLIDGQLLQTEADEDGKVPFYRYTTYNPENNASLLYGVSNTQYYWSLSNPEAAQFMNETGQLNRMVHQYDTLDDRTMLNEIAGIRYFLGSDAEGIPYGYQKKEGLSYSNQDLWPENTGLNRYACEVYENQYALPFGFTSDKWISREEYDAMDIPQRQQALMQGILLESDPGEGFTQITSTVKKEETAGAGTAGDTAGNTLAFTDVRIPVQIEYEGETIPVESGKEFSLEVAEEGKTMTVRFAGMNACETGLYIRGLRYTPPAGKKGATKVELPVTGYLGDRIAASKILGHAEQTDPWTTGRRDYLVNMRYWDQAVDHVVITFPEKGTYSFASVEAVCQPMTNYAQQAGVLRASALTDLDIHETESSYATDRITGHIELQTPQILCLQIPCTAGWSVYVDGTRTSLLKADTMFSAVLLPAGSHDIELRYQTPGLRLGAALSLGTLLVFILFCLIYTIVSAVLHGREKRLEAIPAGTYTSVLAEGNGAGTIPSVPAGDDPAEKFAGVPAEDDQPETITSVSAGDDPAGTGAAEGHSDKTISAEEKENPDSGQNGILHNDIRQNAEMSENTEET